jgi:hypothetical protein
MHSILNAFASGSYFALARRKAIASIIGLRYGFHYARN